jgi:hypothetical protein
LVDTGPTATLAMSAPRFLLQTRAIDPASLILGVIVNGSPVDMQLQGDEWVGSIHVPAGDIASIELTWSQNIGDGAGPLRLATYSDTVGPISTSISLPLTAEQYISEGIDDDQDGLSNLEELLAGSNARDATDPGSAPADDVEAVFIDVSIPEIAASDAPVIDGYYEDVWNASYFSDTSGDTLSIDNLLVGEPDNRTDENTEFQWTALHDRTYLYIFVAGEKVENATLFADSVSAWQDDSVELYLDGDNSKLSTYDQINDYLFVLPHLKLKEPFEANNSFDADGRVGTGAYSTPFPEDFAFSSCLCADDRFYWEIRVNLEQSGIRTGQPFGIELQLNDDVNGGERDVKWGWIHPSLYSEGAPIDSTWRNPGLMGTAILE